MSKQVTHSDGRLATIGQSRAKVRQPARDRIIQLNFASLDQNKRRGGNYRLGHGSKPEYGVTAYRPSACSISQTGGAGKNDVSIASSENSGSDNTIFR
jgi:hypothetical protein